MVGNDPATRADIFAIGRDLDCAAVGNIGFIGSGKQD